MLGLRVVTPLHDPFPTDLVLPLDRRRTLVGRELGSDLRLRHPTVAPTHAALVHDGRAWVIEDLGSEHGSQVDGEPIQRAYLRAGNTLRFGAVEVAVVELAAAPEVAPPLVAPAFGLDPARPPWDQVDAPRVPEADGLEVTPTFVFVFPNRLKKTLGVAPPPGFDRPRILPRLDEELRLLGGVIAPPPRSPEVELAAVAPDRTTYRPEGDPIVIAVVAPDAAGQSVSVKLWHGRRPQPPYAVPVDAHGLGRLELPWLPPGDYVVAIEGRPATAAGFRVGDLTVAPLAVEVLELGRATGSEGQPLVRARLTLTSYGTEVHGAVRVMLLQEGRRVSMHEAEHAGGALDVELEVHGDADATLVVSLVDDPTRTAEVPIPPPDADARRDALLRPMDPEAPLRVRDATAPVVIEATRPCVAVGVTVLDPATRQVHHTTREAVAAGELITPDVEVRGPMAWVFFAAIVDGPYGLAAWRGRATVLAAPRAITLEVPATVAAGTPCALGIHAPWASARAAAWVFVRDRRLAPGEGIAARRRAAALGGAQMLGGLLPAYAPDAVKPSARRRTTVLEIDPPPPVAPQPLLSASPLARGAGREPELDLFAGVVPLIDGRASVSLLAHEGDRDHTIDVVVVDGPTLAGARATLEVEARLDEGAERDAPADAGRARVRAPIVVPPYASVSVDDDPGVVSFELPPTPRAAFAALVRATAEAPRGGLEPSAARLLAWATLVDLTSDAAEQARIDRMLRALAASLARMRDGDRLTVWSGGPHHPDVAARATMHLASILALPCVRPGARHAWLGDAVREILPRAALTPTLATRTPGEAWRLVCLGAPVAAQAPIARAIAPMVTSVSARVDAAYAAAVLARTGDSADRVVALATTRALVKRVGANGRLASTWDSGALLALAAALGDVGADDDLQLDGEAIAPGDRAAGRRARWVSAGASGALVVALRDVDEEPEAVAIDVPIDAQLVGPRGYGKVIHVGDVVRLEATIPTVVGDVVRIELPPALVALHGGARTRRLELDPAGARSFALTLLAIAPTETDDDADGDGNVRTQTGRVSLRNAYDEGRGGRAELTVVVAP